MARAADTYVTEFCSNKNIQNPFGGEVGRSDPSYAFLTRLIIDMSPWFRLQRLPASMRIHENDQIEEQDDFNVQLMQSGFVTVNEILASTLGVDNSLITRLRLYLGQETTILQESAKSLGIVLDDLADKSIGRKARDIHLTEDDQRLLIAMVQFVGNLCFRCKHNQDLLRTTLVPPSKHLVQKAEVADGGDGEKNTTTSSDSVETMRNGLHVLLTCTTHATSCFTLREWGVIAIRNVLEDNSKNQAVVEALMAQGPVESAELEEAGVRVQLDSKGEVSLTPIKETKAT